MAAEASHHGDRPLNATTEAAADAGQDDEQNMSIPEVLRYYRPAAMWSVLIALTNIMEGYNIPVSGGMVLFPPFAEKYGTYEPGYGYIVTAPWQTAIGMAATIGGIFGVIFGGFMIERIGTRYTIMMSNVFITGAIFIQFYAVDMPMLFAATIVNGIPWGVLSSVGAIYSSEVCPTALRGYIINFSNFSLQFGVLLSTIVLQAKVTDLTEWAYKLPFALQWIFPLPLFVIAALAPDSPWWLLRHGEIERAKAALKRLSRGRSDEQIDAQIASMVRTDEYEKKTKTESNYRDIFRGTNLRRTEIASFALSSQGLTGGNLASNPTYFMDQVGLDSLNAFRIGCAAAGISLIGNIICWGFMAKFGRRSLFIFGLVGMTILLLFIGLLDSFPSSGAIWAQAGLCLAWVLVFSVFVAPESYTIAGEISATRVRAQTTSFAKGVYGVTAIGSAIGQVYMTNPTAGNLKGKSAYVWFAVAILYIFWAIFRLPETKGKTYQEIDFLFEGHVSARHFNDGNGMLVDEIEQYVHVNNNKSTDAPGKAHGGVHEVPA